MAFLQSDVPQGPIYCWVRSEYLYGGTIPEGVPKLYECQLIGIRSARGRAIGFHILMENGACWAPPAVPLSALVHDVSWSRIKSCGTCRLGIASVTPSAPTGLMLCLRACGVVCLIRKTGRRASTCLPLTGPTMVTATRRGNISKVTSLR